MIHRIRNVGRGVGVECAIVHTEHGLFDIWYRSLLDMTKVSLTHDI